jgi:hypothetical protein
MSVVTFHDGTTATLRDADELTNRETKLLQRKIRSAASAASKMRKAGYNEKNPESWATALADLTDEEMDDIDLFQRACVVMRLQSWTLDRALPATEEEVDDLPRPIFLPLTIAASDIKLSEDFSVVGASDPKARTEGSGSSKQRTKAGSS